MATHNSFHSADANGSAPRAVGSSPGDARSQNTPSSPIDHLTGQFNSVLSRAFGSVRLSRPFPVSPCVSESAKSGVSTSKQPHQCPETCDGVDVESQCGSIGQAPSFADESGAATSVHVQDGKSAKSSNSIRSSLADIFRSKHRSPSSKTVQSHSRESVLASVDATTTSPGFLPTPHAEDVNILFSTSRDSIAIGMPSVPSSSLVDSTILLKSDIPHSSMDAGRRTLLRKLLLVSPVKFCLLRPVPSRRQGVISSFLNSSSSPLRTMIPLIPHLARNHHHTWLYQLFLALMK